MARVTVEDCVLRVPNRFELVLLAGQRARDIASGGTLTVERDNDKNPVVALREIADETVSLDLLQNALIKGMQKHVEIDEPEEDREFAPDAEWTADLPVAEATAPDGAEADLDEVVQEDALLAEEEPDAEENLGELPDEALDEEP